MPTCVACGVEAHPDGWFRTYRVDRGDSPNPDHVESMETVDEVWTCDEHRKTLIVESGHPSVPPGVGRVIVDGRQVATMRTG